MKQKYKVTIYIYIYTYWQNGRIRKVIYTWISRHRVYENKTNFKAHENVMKKTYPVPFVYRYMSTTDLANSYWQITLHMESRIYAAFFTVLECINSSEYHLESRRRTLLLWKCLVWLWEINPTKCFDNVWWRYVDCYFRLCSWSFWKNS